MRWLTLLLLLGAALASPNRYALVVGINAGRGPDALSPLRHAERDAAALRASLLHYGRFSPERVEIVTGGGRAEILAAVERLSDQARQDQARFGDRSTLFGFFFTGHGLEGRLLTADEPLTSEDVRGVFDQMDATLSFGFVDACHSGSMALQPKGAVPTGFNPVEAMPEELLSAEGTVWLVSSRPEEVSYEDPSKGGLFTHYFLEAFTAVPADRFGVSLEAMWTYARQHTAEYAGQHGRAQSPQKIVRALEAHGPIYFSFPHRRSARLELGAELDGEFRIAYRDDTLVERVRKARGRPMILPIHPGPVEVQRADGARWRLEIADGARVRLGASTLKAARVPGYAATALELKGGVGGDMIHPRADIYLGAGLGFSGSDETLALPAQRLALTGDWIRGRLSLGGALRRGAREVRVPAWPYELEAYELEGHVGWGRSLWRLRGEALAGLSAEAARLDYLDTGASRIGWSAGALVGARAWLDLDPVALRVRAVARVGRAESAAWSGQARGFLLPEISAALVWRAW